MHLLSTLIRGWRVGLELRTIRRLVLVRSFDFEPVGFDSGASAVSAIMRAWIRLLSRSNRVLDLRSYNAEVGYWTFPAPEEKQTLLHLNPSVGGTSDSCGIADITR
jgi:hypothetical protein